MLKDVLAALPDSPQKQVVILSGGLDSSILTALLSRRYGAQSIVALSFDYDQKQRVELARAGRLCELLKISHEILDLKVLGSIARPVSANVKGSAIAMPAIKEVLGDPQPKTYVPFRNLIFLSIALARAEALNASHVYAGLQIHDEYGYWDTTEKFVASLNAVAIQNRLHRIQILAPLGQMSKFDELELAKELGIVDLLVHTISCYDPDDGERSCGRCPSCSERIANFAKAGLVDKIGYQIELDWTALIDKFKVTK